jgi:hypothetical protein
MTIWGCGLGLLNVGAAADMAGALLAGMIRMRSYEDAPIVPERGLAM